VPVPDVSAAQITMMQNLKTQALPRRRPMSNQPHPSCLCRQASGGKLILHLLGRAEAELAGRRNLDGLACPRVTALTRRAVFDLELTKAQQTDLFAFLRGLDDAGKTASTAFLAVRTSKPAAVAT
jgi:hypothetical protein